jgi:hypothetical protein
MAIQMQGNGGVVAEVDGTGFRAVRMTSRPTEYGTLGHYRYGGFTGIIPAALAANSELFQFQWTDATRFCVVQEVAIEASVSTTFFAAGVPVQIDLIKSTAFTVAGTGGTAVAIGTSNKMRTSMGSSLGASAMIRIATTAALGAGTKTFDANSLSVKMAGGPITASLNGSIFPPNTGLLEPDAGSGEHPLVLVASEGFSIRSVAVPATGTWSLAVNVRWAEVAAY